MLTVGIRKLKQQTSELIRMVRETGSEIQVTYHGQVVALLIPVNRTKPKNAERAWTQLDSLAAEISTNWKTGVSAARAVSEGRR
jgi:prevent-host-death family protein